MTKTMQIQYEYVQAYFPNKRCRIPRYYSYPKTLSVEIPVMKDVDLPLAAKIQSPFAAISFGPYLINSGNGSEIRRCGETYYAETAYENDALPCCVIPSNTPKHMAVQLAEFPKNMEKWTAIDDKRAADFNAAAVKGAEEEAKHFRFTEDGRLWRDTGFFCNKQGQNLSADALFRCVQFAEPN